MAATLPRSVERAGGVEPPPSPRQGDALPMNHTRKGITTATRAGVEPATIRLTAGRSAVEPPGRAHTRCTSVSRCFSSLNILHPKAATVNICVYLCDGKGNTYDALPPHIFSQCDRLTPATWRRIIGVQSWASGDENGASESIAHTKRGL